MGICFLFLLDRIKLVLDLGSPGGADSYNARVGKEAARQGTPSLELIVGGEEMSFFGQRWCWKSSFFFLSRMLAALILTGSPAMAQLPDRLAQELERIFQAREYRSRSFGPARWIEDGRRYTTLEPVSDGEGRDIVAYETSTGTRSVLVESKALIPRERKEPLEINDYRWSDDHRKLLVFTNSQRVWRQNTRGDYWVLHLETGDLKQLGVKRPEASLMFAKFSKQGARVAYVSGNDLYVESLETGREVRLTSDGSPTIINGTSDWVYEEEFGVRDGFRWSPDGRHIAFWNFDSSGVRDFLLINNTDTLYPEIQRIPYPKAGTVNSVVRIGVIESVGGDIRWMDVPGDPRDNYIARMEWVDKDSLVLQHLNRLQNQNDVLLADVSGGRVRRALRDESTSWVEVFNGLRWLDDGASFLWQSERDGWRHLYRVDRKSEKIQLITPFEADVISLVGLDLDEVWVYFTASPESPTQVYLFRARLDGSGTTERITPSDQPGTHGYQLSPDCRWAIRTYSRFDQPPVIDLVALPQHESVRLLEANAELRARVSRENFPPVDFLRLEIEEGLVLDGWMLRPNDFDRSKRYPLLIFVYGEPAGQTVQDRWGGDRMLFHRALAEAGFIVASIDNRGTPAARGVAWRKIIYGTVGDLSSRDQAAAVRQLLATYPYLDPGRVGVWGWSGGGSNTLNAMFRFPELFQVGVSVAPVPDQLLYDTIYQERYMGTPEGNPEGYQLGSPIHFAEGLQGKLMIIHGTGDDNVHYQGTERLINRLIELGKEFDMMSYPNRTHGISEGAGTRLHIYSLIARYLLDHLGEKM